MNLLLKKIIQRTKLYLNDNDQKIISNAYEFARVCHEGQMRKSGEPFINHPLRVALSLTSINSDTLTIAAALLHDVIEDSNVSYNDILKKFGEEVAFLVSGVTKVSKLEYKGEGPNQAENFRNMFLAMSQDLRIVLIKLADRTDNLKTLWALSSARQYANAIETLEVFAPLAYRLGLFHVGAILEDLSFPYAYPKEYKMVSQLSGKRQKVLEKYLEKITPILENHLLKAKIKPINIEYRAKHTYSIWRKLKKEDMDISKVYDLVATRIIVSSMEECYSALGIVHQLWKPVPGRFKDYIANPKPNGYQSLHTTVFGPEARIMEIQIRSEKMNQEAEWGIASHWYYNLNKDRKGYLSNKNNSQFMLDKKFSWLKQLKDWQKEMPNPTDFLELVKNDLLKDRIYVLTPKGDVIDLPDGATPIDFAYHIHSDIGDACMGAKINTRLVNLDYKLKSGDVVEILIKKGKKPSRSWLDIVKMKETKELIRRHLKE